MAQKASLGAAQFAAPTSVRPLCALRRSGLDTEKFVDAALEYSE
jgi:hypothetical protein